MRHRLCSFTGLGNPNQEILGNDFKFPETLKEFADDFIATFSVPKEYNGFDFSFSNNLFQLGIEPSYERDRLEIIAFDLDDKTNCWWEQGIAMGAYGTGIRKTYKFYGDYKRKSKFVKFIDKWYDIVKSEIQGDKNGC